jgi:hypothetical protein
MDRPQRRFSIETSTFRDCGVKRGGTWMFRAPDALRLIAECQKRSCPILGIETFTLRPNLTEPHLNHIADYSSDASPNPSVYAAAVAFVRARETLDLYFEIVFGDPPGE